MCKKEETGCLDGLGDLSRSHISSTG